MRVLRALLGIVRWSIRILAALILLVVVLAGTAVVLLHTDWGRERVRRQLEARLQRIFQGQVSVGTLSGNVANRFTIHGFSITGVDGEVVIGAAEVEIDYSLTALLSGVLHARELRVVAPVVTVERDRDGWNMRHLLRPVRPGGRAWAMIIDRLTVERGSLTVTIDGRPVVSAAGELAADGALRAVAGTLAARLTVEAGGSSVAVPGVTVRGGRVAGMAATHLRATDLTRLVPGVKWPRGDLHAALAVANAVANDGGWHGAAVGAGAADAGSGVFAVHAAGGTLTADVAGNGSGVRGTARASVREEQGAWVLRSGSLHARVPDVGDLLPKQRGHRDAAGDLAGDVAVDVTARGALTGAKRRLTVRGTAVALGLRRGSTRIDSATVRFDLDGLGTPRITGRVGAQGRGPDTFLEMTSGVGLTASGTRLSLGHLRLDTRDLTWRGQGGEVAIDRHGAVSVRDVALASEAGRVEVTGDLAAIGAPMRGRGDQKLHVHVLKMDVGRVQAALPLAGAMHPVHPIEGTVTADAHLIRSGRRLTIEASVEAKKLRLGRRAPALDVQGYAELRDRKLAGRIELVDRAGRRSFDGELAWTDALTVDGRVAIGGRSFAHVNASLHASIDDVLGGRVRVRDATGAARVTLEEDGLRRLRASRFDAAATLDGNGLSAHLRAAQAHGKVDATLAASRGPGPFDLSVMAQNFDLGGLEALAADPLSPLQGIGGRLDASLRITGAWEARGAWGASSSGRIHADHAAGRVAVRDGRLRLQGGARPIDDIRLTARLTGDRLILDELRGTSGRGWLRAQGEAGLDHLRPTTLRLTVGSERLPIQAGRMVVGVGLHARIAGHRQRENGEWRLTADVSEATVEIPRERTAQLQQTGPLEDVVYVDPRGIAERLAREKPTRVGPTVRLHVKAPSVAVRGREVRAEVKLDLEAVYTGADVAVHGDAQVIRGQVELFGRRYEVQHATAAFDGSTPPNPRIDVLLAHEFRTAVVYVVLEGPARKPELTLRSDPPAYDDAELLGFILGGDPDDPSMNRRTVDQRAAGLASGLLVGTVQRRLEDVLPIDVLRLNLAENGSTVASRLEVGKWLTDDVYVSYRYHFGGTNTVEEQNQNEAAFEYRFARRWLFDAYFGDRGVGGADLLWSKRY